MTHRIPALAAILIAAVLGGALPADAASAAKPRKAKVEKGSYAGADGRKNR